VSHKAPTAPLEAPRVSQKARRAAHADMPRVVKSEDAAAQSAVLVAKSAVRGTS